MSDCSGNRRFARVLFDYKADNEKRVDLFQGDVVEVVRDSGNWWRVISQGKEGNAPSNYMRYRRGNRRIDRDGVRNDEKGKTSAGNAADVSGSESEDNDIDVNKSDVLHDENGVDNLKKDEEYACQRVPAIKESSESSSVSPQSYSPATNQLAVSSPWARRSPSTTVLLRDHAQRGEGNSSGKTSQRARVGSQRLEMVILPEENSSKMEKEKDEITSVEERAEEIASDLEAKNDKEQVGGHADRVEEAKENLTEEEKQDKMGKECDIPAQEGFIASVEGQNCDNPVQEVLVDEATEYEAPLPHWASATHHQRDSTLQPLAEKSWKSNFLHRASASTMAPASIQKDGEKGVYTTFENMERRVGAALWRTFRSIGRLPLSQRILLILGNAARPAKGPIVLAAVTTIQRQEFFSTMTYRYDLLRTNPTEEKHYCEWLNYVVHKAMLSIADPFVQDLLPTIQQAIDEAMPPNLTSRGCKLKIAEVYLGTMAPDILDTQVISTDERNNLKLKANLEFCSENAVIRIAAKYAKLPFPIIISGFVFSAPVQITVSFDVNDPMASTIGISFTRLPKVDFQINALVKHVDTMILPGISQFIRSLVDQTITDMFVYPQVFSLSFRGEVLTGEREDLNAPIVDIKVMYTDIEKDLPEGYVVLRKSISGRFRADCNGSGAHDVFIIYKRGKAQLTVRGNDEKTDEITEKPITDITVCNVGVGGNDETPSDDYTLVDRTVSNEFDADLRYDGEGRKEKGKNGGKTFLAFRREPNSPPITQIGVLVDGTEEVLPPAWRCVDRSYENHYSANLNTGRSSHWRHYADVYQVSGAVASRLGKIKFTVSGQSHADLNKGSDGTNCYLVYRRQPYGYRIVGDSGGGEDAMMVERTDLEEEEEVVVVKKNAKEKNQGNGEGEEGEAVSTCTKRKKRKNPITAIALCAYGEHAPEGDFWKQVKTSISGQHPADINYKSKKQSPLYLYVERHPAKRPVTAVQILYKGKETLPDAREWRIIDRTYSGRYDGTLNSVMGRPYYLILRRGRTPPLCGTYDLASGEEAKSSSSCLGMGTEENDNLTDLMADDEEVMAVEDLFQAPQDYPIVGVGLWIKSDEDELPAGWDGILHTVTGRKANLNSGGGGKTIFLAVRRERDAGKTFTESASTVRAPLGELGVLFQRTHGTEPGEELPKKYKLVDSSVHGAKAHMNMGSGGRATLLCYRLSYATEDPITDIQVFFRDKGERPPLGYHVVHSTVSGQWEADCNACSGKGSGGREIFLCYRGGSPPQQYPLCFSLEEVSQSRLKGRVSKLKSRFHK